MTAQEARDMQDRVNAKAKPTVNPFSDKPKKKSKYHNVKTIVDGIPFDSKAEAKRYGELKLMERVGQIFDLELQKKYSIDINGVHICNYIADFVYSNVYKIENVEDTKGMRTPIYNLKKKLMKAVHGIEITEVYSDKKKKKRIKNVTPIQDFLMKEKDILF